jgi:hypothetical protein
MTAGAGLGVALLLLLPLPARPVWADAAGGVRILALP